MVICQAVYQAIGLGELKEMHDILAEVSKRIGVEKKRQTVAGLNKLTYRREDGEHFR